MVQGISRLLRAGGVGSCLLIVVLMWGCASAPKSHDAITPSQQDRLDELVLGMLDREALYTVSGGLKPMSTGFWRHRFETAEPDLELLRETRSLLDRISDETLALGVKVFAREWDGHRYAGAYVIHRASLRRVLEHKRDFWAPLGVDPDTEPAVVVAITERLPRLKRFRAYGYLFGYPDAAVDFFVNAAAEQEATGDLVAREFVSVPTYESPEGRFVWAVPQDYEGDPAEDAIRAEAEVILDRYRSMRARYISESRHEPLRLLRSVRDGDRAPAGYVRSRSRGLGQD